MAAVEITKKWVKQKINYKMVPSEKFPIGTMETQKMTPHSYSDKSPDRK